MSILEVRDVSIIYSDDKRVAVEHASFKIEAGEYACIIGSNGSGKSTLVKGIVGLVPVTSGEVIHALSPEQYAYLSQITEVERDFPATVREVVLTGMQRSGRRFPFYTREDRKKAADAMETLDITDLADYRIGNLSGGQKQRVLLARALCREPKLLILDEPCAGLDPAITAEFYSLIDHINKKQGVTILMVSHDLDQVEQYASHIIMMKHGAESVHKKEDIIMTQLIEALSYPFVQRAIAAGVMISLCAALLGVILVLKQYSLIGHGLGDVGFASTSLAVALGLPVMAVSIPIVVIAACLIMFWSQRSKTGGDTAIGMVATGALSIGVIITAMSSGFNVDVNGYMFGSILAMSREDVIFSVVLSIVILVLFVVFYNRLFLITFDENFAKASGIRVGFYQFLIALLTALTVVMGMRMMGSLLISSLIIFPAVIARKLVVSFKAVAVLSVFLSVICFLAGLILSFEMNLPTGASIVIINLIVLIAVTILNKLRGR